VSSSSWYQYLTSSDVAVGTVGTTMVLFPVAVALDCLQSNRLGHWVSTSGSGSSSSSGNHEHQMISLRKGYGLLFAFFVLAVCLRCWLLGHFIARSSTKLHRDALRAVLRATAPFKFCDSLLVGGESIKKKTGVFLWPVGQRLPTHLGI